jgi:Transposase IS66 family
MPKRGSRNGLQPRIASMFATPVASRTLKGSSNDTERAFRHSPYRNVRGEAGIAGLKKRFLYKFKKDVDLFYKRAINDKQLKSDLAQKYQKLFIRYQNSLFTFLEQDGIPWHNNTAERAIRHIV